MIDVNKSSVIVIDVQEKLIEHIYEHEKMTKRILEVIDAAREVSVPVILTEHFPDKLGLNVPEIRELFSKEDLIIKSAVSCCGSEEFKERVFKDGKEHFILVGIESHICVLQTAMDLLEMGKKVYIVADAVSSRAKDSKELAFERLRQHGVEIINFEMLIFEWVRGGSHPNFKTMIKRVK